MPGCKVGEMAWVSRPLLPENYGKVCEILSETVYEGKRLFNIRFSSKQKLIEFGSDVISFDSEGQAWDEQLTPIRGNLTKKQIEKENLWSTKDERRTVGA